MFLIIPVLYYNKFDIIETVFTKNYLQHFSKNKLRGATDSFTLPLKTVLVISSSW